MTNRCENCKKKVRLVSFECKCEYKILCIKCNLPEYHKCQSLDAFKNSEKELLRKNNSIVISDKLIKI